MRWCIEAKDHVEKLARVLLEASLFTGIVNLLHGKHGERRPFDSEGKGEKILPSHVETSTLECVINYGSTY